MCIALEGWCLYECEAYVSSVNTNSWRTINSGCQNIRQPCQFQSHFQKAAAFPNQGQTCEKSLLSLWEVQYPSQYADSFNERFQLSFVGLILVQIVGKVNRERMKIQFVNHFGSSLDCKREPLSVHPRLTWRLHHWPKFLRGELQLLGSSITLAQKEEKADIHPESTKPTAMLKPARHLPPPPKKKKADFRKHWQSRVAFIRKSVIFSGMK